MSLEGHEPQALLGALRLFQARRVGVAFVEVQPDAEQVWNNSLAPHFMRPILASGYSARFIGSSCIPAMTRTFTVGDYPALMQAVFHSRRLGLRPKSLWGCVDLVFEQIEQVHA